MSTSITATTSTTITTTRTLRVCCAQAARPTPSRKHSLRIVLPPTSAGTAVITYTWPEDRVSYHGPRKDNLPRRKEGRAD
ncbi:hypothetical protein GLOTRDRAFT_129558 [Gloeophyllum trabeum ATCC 11539]|uniref:Uncharacterized protein n=1 Tax=Gloeophyllum trabeum (strain ATCC 11539 / FP-39264 / Madison 617) TaxID=670483 RepID=S7Q759_GLOTA|nr:uncharacterized protein GLOTRDRAFT_129558 [Gloeophyllum trabeum ATCC 11539]EPQ55278.1 hypothetical protein GLOTRDRAFT_129558 [Gloeophyllum trabeum ATCC 11539]